MTKEELQADKGDIGMKTGLFIGFFLGVMYYEIILLIFRR